MTAKVDPATGTASPDVVSRREGSVLVVTLARPGVLNAFRRATFDDLRAALADAEHDTTIGSVVITGEGRAFSAGQDLDELGVDGAGEAAREALERLQGVTREMLAHRVPLVAAVNGVAVGFGAELPLACDVRLAAPSAAFGYVETRRALAQTNGSTWLLPRIVGHGRAARILLTGEMVDAATAVTWGLVSAVEDDVLAAAVDVAERIAANAPLSVAFVRRAMRRTWDADLEEMLGLEVEGMLMALGSDDVHEGVRAFRERREPRWSGR